jgi:hypothetical protein
MAGGKATLLHAIFQKTGHLPWVVMGYEEPEKFSPGRRAFLFASMQVAAGELEVR